MRYPQSTSKMRLLLEKLGVPKPNLYAVELIARPDVPGDPSYGWYLRKSEGDIARIFGELRIDEYSKIYWRSMMDGAFETAQSILLYCIEIPLKKALG